EPLFFYREPLRVNLANYLRSAKTVRRILRVYGPRNLGRWRTAGLLAQSHAKDAIYRILARLGLEGTLIRRRNRALESADAEAARAIVADILATPLPGLESSDARRELVRQ